MRVSLIVALHVWLFFFFLSEKTLVVANVLYCDTVGAIYRAMVNVQPGDEIVIAPGFYYATRLAISGTEAHFASFVDGTQEQPIVMRSADPSNPAVLSGSNPALWTVVRIYGAFWTVQDLTVTNAQKGIVFDNAPFGNVLNCTVHGIGLEGIHWRDGSDFGLIEGCRIYDTGLTTPGFGEAIYIGTDKGAWGRYDRDVTYVTVRNCHIGPGIAAEALDIKEGTEEIVVENNYIDATGISSMHFADSFIDLKGTRSYIRHNVFVRNGESRLRKGIAVIDRDVELSSYQHVIHDNVFYLDADGGGIDMVVAHGGTTDVYAWNNQRVPSNGRYYSNSVHTSCCPEWYTNPTDSDCFAPYLFQLNDVTDTSVVLSWVGGTTALGFMVEFAVQGRPLTSSATLTPFETYTIDNLLPETTYVARVDTVCDGLVESPFTAPLIFTTTASASATNDDPLSPDDPFRGQARTSPLSSDGKIHHMDTNSEP